MAMLADMAAGKQVFRIHDDNPDRTACLIKSHPDGDLKNIALRAGLASPNQLRHGSA